MPVILESLTMHGTQRVAMRDIPVHKLAALMKKCKLNLVHGRQHDTYECDVRIGGVCYHCVLQCMCVRMDRMYARLITAYVPAP